MNYPPDIDYIVKNELSRLIEIKKRNEFPFSKEVVAKYYDKYLTGVKGYIVEESDVSGVKLDNSLSSYIPSIPGLNLNLTIDINIQMFVDEALKLLMEEQKPKKASLIVMNPNNGEIVAMASKPDFNLNDIPRDDVQTLLDTVKNINIVDVSTLFIQLTLKSIHPFSVYLTALVKIFKSL